MEEKSALALEYTKLFGNTAMQIFVKIFAQKDIAMLKDFVHALHFINNYFKSFAAEYFTGLIYPTNFIRNHLEYFPFLLDTYQHDSHALLSDIIGFGSHIEAYLAICKSEVKLNKYIHIAYTVHFYLASIKKYNPAFWHLPEVYLTDM